MTDLLDRLSAYGIKGKRNSSNEYVGKCPIHKGNHDTFAVNLDTGFYFCFSGKCRAKGHISKLIGVIDKEYTSKDTDNIFDFDEDISYKLPDKSELEDWKKIHPYILHRGFDKTFLIQNLIGYSRNDLSITIPVFLEGVYYGAIKRKIVESDGPKYTYPKGFPKKTLVYQPLYVNRFGSVNLDRLLVVEGSINALKAAQNGYDCVAVLGCSPNEDQIQWLVKLSRKLGKRITFLFDNDESGVSGVLSVLKRYFWLDCDVASIENLKYVDNKNDLCYTMVDNEGNKIAKNDIDNLTRKELDYVASVAKERTEYELLR